MTKILGIKYGGHDTSAALLINGKIVAACAQERYSRDKHSRRFPLEAIQDCLKISNLKITFVFVKSIAQKEHISDLSPEILAICSVWEAIFLI